MRSPEDAEPGGALRISFQYLEAKTVHIPPGKICNCAINRAEVEVFLVLP
jgi:hypothetical protein